MYIEPIYVQYTLMFLLSFCAFMVGRLYQKNEEDVIIESTIHHLIDNGYVRSKTNAEGETEILKINGQE